MKGRVDSASYSIAASPDAVYRAFAEPGAMERWLPPHDMTGEMLHFDFREGGSYRLRLTYAERHRGSGKTSDDADEVAVRLTKLDPGRSIEQAIVFESADPAFAGVMRMTWAMVADGDRTLVTVRAEDVPAGIRAEDHVPAMAASLEQLAGFVEASAEGPLREPTVGIDTRQATQADVAALLQLDAIPSTDPNRANFIRAAVDGGRCLVAVRGASVLGYGVLEYSFFGHGFVSLVRVAREDRRQGVGTALLAALGRRCTTPKLFTSTNASNLPMQALLARCGFEPSGIVHNLDPGDPELVYVRFRGPGGG